MKKIYLVRHCTAEGQEAGADLTEVGHQQAVDLAAFFESRKIDRVISSPFKRAIQTIEPLTTRLNIEIETSSKLAERVLSTQNMPDWFERLRVTYEDFELKYEGGESSREATNRIVEVVDGVLKADAENTIIVTHGGLLSLLLHHYDNNLGYEQWAKLTNPDVYLLTSGKLERIWET